MGINDERDRYSLEYHGLKCLILRHQSMKYFCAYVKVSDTNIIWKNENIEVHGGVTFDNELGEKEPGHWVGFDCAHAGDLVSGMPDMVEVFGFIIETYRDVDYVKRELEGLAGQIATRLVQFTIQDTFSSVSIIENVKKITYEPSTRVEELEVNSAGRDREILTFLQGERSEKDKSWGIEL